MCKVQNIHVHLYRWMCWWCVKFMKYKPQFVITAIHCLVLYSTFYCALAPPLLVMSSELLAISLNKQTSIACLQLLAIDFAHHQHAYTHTHSCLMWGYSISWVSLGTLLLVPEQGDSQSVSPGGILQQSSMEGQSDHCWNMRWSDSPEIIFMSYHLHIYCTTASYAHIQLVVWESGDLEP